MDTYEVFYRNPDKTISGQITTFEELILTPVFNGIGTWSLRAPVDVLLEIVWRGGIVVKRNGELFFTGRVTSMHRQKDNTTFPAENVMEVAGENDLGYLQDVLALPVPGGPPYTSAEFDIRTGAFETIAKQYVEYNAGPLARTDRVITGLTVETNYGRGAQVTGNARFGYLLDLLKSLADQSGGVGFDIVDMQFIVYEIADKSTTVVFSEDLGNLSGFTYDLTRPKANYIYLGGSGEGSARIITDNSDSESILQFERIEAFVDERSLSDATQMDARIQEELTSQAKQFSLQLKVIDLPQMRPIDDYWLGDRVTAIIDGSEITDVIASARITITATTVTVEPVIGYNDLDADEVSSIFSTIRKVSGRVSSLERN